MSKKSKSNILFILVDSLRADKFYQKNSENSTINNLIQSGTYFSNAFSSSDYTITGYGSIFTSKYPINAGLTGMNYHKIFSKTPNFISILKENGYHTYTTMDNSLQNLGFSSYFENIDQGYDRVKINLFEGLDKIIINKIKSGELKAPWFYFIHLDDLHIPIRVPKKFQTKKYSERYDLIVSKIDSWLNEILKNINLDETMVIITSDHGDYMLSVDDSKKNNMASSLKTKLRKTIPAKSYDLLSKIKEDTKKQMHETISSNIEKRTLNSRTSKHRYLFDDVIHTPLLFVGNNIPQSNIITDLVRHVDIFPTILDLLQLPKINFEIDGRSIIPLMHGKNLNEIPIYLENTVFATGQQVISSCVGLRTSKYKYFRRLNKSNPSQEVKNWWNELSTSDFDKLKTHPNFSSISQKITWKKLTSEKQERITAYYNSNIESESALQDSSTLDDAYLFDLEKDPNEMNNIFLLETKTSSTLEKSLIKIREKLLRDFVAPKISDDEIKKVEDELKKLGYV